MVYKMGEGGVDFVFLYHPHPYDMNPGAQLGLGLLLLATYAKKLGASVRVINAQEMKVEDAIGKIPKCTYLMLYGCMVDINILDTISKKALKKAGQVFIGGPISLSLYAINDRIIFVPGFGEDLIEHLCRGYDDFYIIDTSTLRHSIDYYPFPDRSLIDGNYGGNIFKLGESGKSSTTLLTSRGCRYHCAFCTSGSDGFFDEYPLYRIEKDLESCLRLGIKNIRISDDNLISNEDRIMYLCGLFQEAGIRWRGSIRTFPNDLDLYVMMKMSGCEELSFGIESGDEKVLKILAKANTVEHNTIAVQNAMIAGIFTRALMMMGTPGETEETVYKNMQWIKTASPHMVSLKMFVPYPNTDIYHNPEKYKCKIHLPIVDPNNSAYRPDNLKPKAHIDSEELYDIELTHQFHMMMNWIEQRGIENRG